MNRSVRVNDHDFRFSNLNDPERCQRENERPVGYPRGQWGRDYDEAKSQAIRQAIRDERGYRY